MSGVAPDDPRPPMQAIDRDIRVVLDVLLENALLEEALQFVRHFPYLGKSFCDLTLRVAGSLV